MEMTAGTKGFQPKLMTALARLAALKLDGGGVLVVGRTTYVATIDSTRQNSRSQPKFDAESKS